MSKKPLRMVYTVVTRWGYMQVDDPDDPIFVATAYSGYCGA